MALVEEAVVEVVVGDHLGEEEEEDVAEVAEEDEGGGR